MRSRSAKVVVHGAPLLVIDAITRHDRFIAATLLLPATAVVLWIAYTGPGSEVANGATQAHTGVGAVVALLGCALTYSSLFLRRPASIRPHEEAGARRH